MARPRVRVPRRPVPAGDIVTIKTLISHDMESGQRKDRSGNVIPRQIINTFRADYMGETVFEVAIEPAVSTNPYFEFTVKAAETSDITFMWLDDDGSEYTATKTLKVS